MNYDSSHLSGLGSRFRMIILLVSVKVAESHAGTKLRFSTLNVGSWEIRNLGTFLVFSP